MAVDALEVCVESHFAQRLAANEKKIRDRAIKKLRQWLQLRSSNSKDAFSEADFLKIWKGLHYCLWMQDKPLIQEELVDNISQLVHVFPGVDMSFLFIKVFFVTEAREWNGTDLWRLDKFMMLIRRMVNQSFTLIKLHGWKAEHIAKHVSVLSETVLDTVNDVVPDGLIIHFADLYLGELNEIGEDQLTEKQVLKFLEPFCLFISKAKNMTIVHRVVSRVFLPIIDQFRNSKLKPAGDGEVAEEELLKLKFPKRLLADQFFKLGSAQKCHSKNRALLKTLVKRFSNVSRGRVRVQQNPLRDVKDLTALDYQAAIDRLQKMELGILRENKGRKKKPTRIEDDNNNDNDDSTKGTPFTIVTGTPVSLGKKRKKEGKDDTETEMTALTTDEWLQQNKKSNKKKVDQCRTTKKKRKLEKKSEFDDGGKSKKFLEKATEVNLTTKTGRKTVGSEKPSILETNINLQMSIDNDKSNAIITSVSSPNLSNSSAIVNKKERRKSVAGIESKISRNVDKTRRKSDPGLDALELLHKGKLKGLRPGFSGHNRSEQMEANTQLNGVQNESKIKKEKNSFTKLEKKRKISDNVDNSFEKIPVPKTPDGGADLVENEVEIWIPNKKYKGKLKELASDTPKKRKLQSSSFAAFEKSSVTPTALVRKLRTPKTDPGKITKIAAVSGSVSMSAKKVSFNMSRNSACNFKDSIKFSPGSPFDPKQKPNQGILRATPLASSTPAVISKKNKLKNGTPRNKRHSVGKQSQDGTLNRSIAADFFN